jgi:hypothetical protein
MPSRGRPAVEISADARDFVKLLGRMSELDKATKAALRKELRAQAKVGADAAKREVRRPALKTARRPHERGLRAALAGSIKIRFSTGASSSRVGVFIESKGAGLDGGRKKLVRRWDTDKPFRHPVWGGPAWATQYGPAVLPEDRSGRASPR